MQLQYTQLSCELWAAVHVSPCWSTSSSALINHFLEEPRSNPGRVLSNPIRSKISNLAFGLRYKHSVNPSGLPSAFSGLEMCSVVFSISRPFGTFNIFQPRVSSSLSSINITHTAYCNYNIFSRSPRTSQYITSSHSSHCISSGSRASYSKCICSRRACQLERNSETHAKLWHTGVRTSDDLSQWKKLSWLSGLA